MADERFNDALADFTNSVADCDVVFDTVGGQVHQDSYKVLKRGGRLVYLLAKPFDDLSGDYGVEDIQVNVFGHTANLAKVIEFASKGIIKPLIGHSLRLSDFRKAFELGESGQAGGKIVLAVLASRPAICRTGIDLRDLLHQPHLTLSQDDSQIRIFLVFSIFRLRISCCH